jgi:hypothetical protein
LEKDCFAEFAQNVMELKGTKQQHGDQAYLKELLVKFFEQKKDKINSQEKMMQNSFVPIASIIFVVFF